MRAGAPAKRSADRGRFKADFDPAEQDDNACPTAADLLAGSDITTTEGRVIYRAALIKLLSHGRITTKEYDSLLRAAYDQAKDQTNTKKSGKKSIRFREIDSKADAERYNAEQRALRQAH